MMPLWLLWLVLLQLRETANFVLGVRVGGIIVGSFLVFMNVYAFFP